MREFRCDGGGGERELGRKGDPKGRVILGEKEESYRKKEEGTRRKRNALG